jgi:glycine betaine/choline ABC-type transport system substrate-binding protein
VQSPSATTRCASFPRLRAALATLSGRITGPAMRHMSEEVDIDHKAAVNVAREFLHYVEVTTWK